ncbi:MAG: histidinol-phosphate aminotransferase family protein [Desulfobacteraceae bacterium]|nr:histidinol-phosphate aminotransferase family protein [Desulfobacteraceae bacterium]
MIQEQLIRHMDDDTRNFYFMINPYFPTPGMMARVSENLPHLIRYYPSNQEVIAGKIKQVEKIDLPLIAVNGSCEAIRVLLQHTPGRKLVTVPNFNEWEITEHLPMAYDASTREIMDAIRENHIEMVCICNPNNPTGFYRDDIQALVDAFPKVKFAIDISFIDFVDETIPPFPKGNNVILIKSLGKNYGVCGLRLGYIASADEELIAALAPAIPIWNINSITEFLLDLILENREAYESSRIKIIHGTARMVEILKQFPFLKVFPTKANFAMIHTLKPMEFNLKNCANKTGLDQNYYRVAYNKNYEALNHLITM